MQAFVRHTATGACVRACVRSHIHMWTCAARVCSAGAPRGVVSFGLMRFWQSFSSAHLPFIARSGKLVNIRLLPACVREHRKWLLFHIIKQKKKITLQQGNIWGWGEENSLVFFPCFSTFAPWLSAAALSPLFSADAKRASCDGACWRRLGDLCKLPAEAWPLSRGRTSRQAGGLQGQSQAASLERLTWQLHGGRGPLPCKEVDECNKKKIN